VAVSEPLLRALQQQHNMNVYKRVYQEALDEIEELKKAYGLPWPRPKTKRGMWLISQKLAKEVKDARKHLAKLEKERNNQQ
jgi:hypothetical protein